MLAKEAAAATAAEEKPAALDEEAAILAEETAPAAEDEEEAADSDSLPALTPNYKNPLEDGACVRVVDLQKQPERNGTRGHLKEYHHKSSRWVVWVTDYGCDTGARLMVKKENLQRISPEEDQEEDEVLAYLTRLTTDYWVGLPDASEEVRYTKAIRQIAEDIKTSISRSQRQ